MKRTIGLVAIATSFLAGCSAPAQLDRMTSRLAEAVTTADPAARKPDPTPPIPPKVEPSCKPPKGDGFIRVDYLEGNVNSIFVSGLSKNYTLQRGEFISERLPLGEYLIKATGAFKTPVERKVCLNEPAQIYIASFVAPEAELGLFNVRPAESLFNDYGRLQVLTDTDGTTFDITTSTVKEFEVCQPRDDVEWNERTRRQPELRKLLTTVKLSCFAPKKLKAPSEYWLTAGEYQITYKNKISKVLVNAGADTVFEIPATP